ncbi:MAG TPA: hypothetical protein VIX86_22770 [Streptosporangiaceae bacterium]
MTAVSVAGRPRLASPATAALLAGLAAGLLLALVVLTIATRDLAVSADGAGAVIALSFGAVGLVVARRQPGNPLGWIMLGTALASALGADAELYAVLNFRIHHGSLPLADADALWAGALWPLGFVVGTPALILFPDGQVPSRRWRWVMWVYVAASGLWLAGQVTGAVSVIALHHFQVDAYGSVSFSPAGLAGAVSGFSWLFAALLPVIWLAWLGRQIGSYRGTTDQRREQLKWLTSGAAVCIISLLVSELAAGGGSATARAVDDVSRLAIAAFPVSMGVAILRYRLYDIDRIISRTLAYAIVTGLLVGVYAGLVLLATQVLPLSSSVAVAVATLAAAALFNPLRQRVQRMVDRRFNRARYNADHMAAAFAARLKDATDLDGVQADLLGTVGGALEPAHASVWLGGGRS